MQSTAGTGITWFSSLVPIGFGPQGNSTKNNIDNLITVTAMNNKLYFVVNTGVMCYTSICETLIDYLVSLEIG